MSWFWVILGLIIFWPIGLILLFKKINDDRTANIKSGGLVALISYVLISISAYQLLMFATRGSSAGLTFAIAMGIGGIWLNRISRNMKRTGKRYRQYIDLVVNQSQYSIDHIASVVGVSYDVAVNDLQKMISMGYFRGASVDYARRTIGLPVPVAHAPVVGHAQGGFVQERVAACPGCGANNRVSGAVSMCEYCGSPIS